MNEIKTTLSGVEYQVIDQQAALLPRADDCSDEEVEILPGREEERRAMRKWEYYWRIQG